MWQSNVSDFPQPVFKASSLRNLLKFLIEWSFMNWQMYMRSIYWQAMPKVKKNSHKQRQRLYKVRKRYERATNEKEVQAKHALKYRAYRVDVHVPNNNLVFAATYVFVVWNFTCGLPCWRVFNYYSFLLFLWVGGWKGGRGGGLNQPILYGAVYWSLVSVTIFKMAARAAILDCLVSVL